MTDAPLTHTLLGQRFAGRRIAVLGLARSGLAAAQALIAGGAEVAAWDRQDVAREQLEGQARMADPLEMDLAGFDAVVVSPGVPLNSHPIVAHAAQYGVPVIGDIELFALARGQLPAHKVVSITGTNGKSTTTALVQHILEHAGIPSLMGGNIGVPILGQAPLREGGVYVLELSSYQIDLTRSLNSDVAVLLNLTPDHLDRYAGFDAYAQSKARLMAMQHDNQLAIFGASDHFTSDIMQRESARRAQGRVVALKPEDLRDMQSQWPALQGPHNLENVAAAVAVARELGVTASQWQAALMSFNGLPHRMERVAEHHGVLYVNDSKATNTASAAPALAAWPARPEPRIHWILGGLPKEDGLGECEQYIGNIAAAYTIGDAGPRFGELLRGRVPVHDCEVMAVAVQEAVARARPGDVVLLSPACASFDQFRDYEKRGDCFRSLVKALIEKDPHPYGGDHLDNGNKAA
ncbi:MAG: UDP-N-acetylmuramoyl-L-alanine--D-glutamate ligase [Sphingomonadaceae bacterium]